MAPTTSKRGNQARPPPAAAKPERRSTSRHSTPVSVLTENSPPTPMTATPSTITGSASSLPKETPYLHTATSALLSPDPSIETLIEKHRGTVTKPGDPPGARDLQILGDKIRDTVARTINRRSDVCNRGVRQIAQRHKTRQAEQEQLAMRAEEERVKIKREDDPRRKEKKALHKKRSHDEMEVDDEDAERKEKKESLPSVGAHGVARQDGTGGNQGAQAPLSPPVPPGTIVDDPMDNAPSPSDSEISQADPPSTAPLYERLFGKDPTQVTDPIIYDIRDITGDMTKDEKQAILNVAQWPESDLRDLIAGDPPDMDFSNAKPANQVNFSTFLTYIEPYTRPFTEEDVSFLKERGDRFTPYLIPQRGAKGYKEVWAAEDGTTGIEPPQRQVNNPNEARGSMEDLDDDLADQDTVSMGPIMSRLLSIVRAQPSTSRRDDTEDANGDTSMMNGDAETAEPLAQPGAEEQKPFSSLIADAPKQTSVPQTDYESFEQRALQELRHIGFLAPTEVPDYESHNDDEVAARLRTLQFELRRVARLNNIRKARVLELTEERMAMQEYSNIADDLDNQVNAAYLKRNRSLARPNQKKGGGHTSRPGQKGVASGVMSARGVSDGVRALMQKRRDWIDMVGPVVAYGRPPIPADGETIFDEVNVKRLEKIERLAEMGDTEGE